MKTTYKNSLRCAAVLMTATLCSSLSAADNEALPNSPTRTLERRADDTSALSHSDRTFLEKAAKSGRKEVEISEAVVSRLADPQIKAVAQSMVSDHAAVNTELMALAARKGVSLQPEKDSLKAGEKWAKKTKDLDDDYLKEMKDDHEEAVKLFEKALKSDDADIAAFARKTLPALQHHLMTVKQIKKATN